ncbi:MAG: Gfo/Idh/MocA family oxidoreductase [Oricola sp.]
MRIAVIGAGVIGMTHLDALDRVQGFSVSGIVEPGPTAAGVANRYGCELHYDIDALIAARPDGVIVATPNETHVPITLRLIEAGIPALVEKPLASTIADARALLEASARLGVPVMTGHHRRFNPIVDAARSLASSAEFGHLVNGSVLCTLRKPADYFDMAWRSRPGVGGPLLINLIHEIDLLRHLFGEIVTVTGIASTRERGLAVEDTAGAVLGFRDGGIVTVSISDASAAPWAWDITAGENPGRFPVHAAQSHFFGGSEGAFSLPDLAVWTYPAAKSWTNTMRARRVDIAPADSYDRQIRHFGDVIAGRATPRCSAIDGARNLAVIEAIKLSSETGRHVALDHEWLTAAPVCRPELETES